MFYKFVAKKEMGKIPMAQDFYLGSKEMAVHVNVWRTLMDRQVLVSCGFPSGMLTSWVLPQEQGSVWTTFWTNARCKVPFRPEQTQEDSIIESKEAARPYSAAQSFHCLFSFSLASFKWS